MEITRLYNHQPQMEKAKIAKHLLTFYTQIIVVNMIIITSLVQICLRSPGKKVLLISLSSSIGYILPSPGLKFRKQSSLYLNAYNNRFYVYSDVANYTNIGDVTVLSHSSQIHARRN